MIRSPSQRYHKVSEDKVHAICFSGILHRPQEIKRVHIFKCLLKWNKEHRERSKTKSSSLKVDESCKGGKTHVSWTKAWILARALICRLQWLEGKKKVLISEGLPRYHQKTSGHRSLAGALTIYIWGRAGELKRTPSTTRQNIVIWEKWVKSFIHSDPKSC